jgi:hypothetical protein
MGNKDFKIKTLPSKNKKEKKAEIVLENELTIFTLEPLQHDLLKALDEYDEIKIKLKNIENIDLSFIQYLFSLQTFAAAKSKNLSFTAEFSDEIKSLLVNTGLLRLFN